MTKIVLKRNCGDSNPPFMAENLPFLENIFGLPFSLNILLVFETLPSWTSKTNYKLIRPKGWGIFCYFLPRMVGDLPLFARY